MITQARLKQLFSYDPETGWFINLVSRGRAAAGERAGHLDIHGYRRIVIDYIKYYEHHLAWFYMIGEWPEEIDHVNGVSDANQFDNLRECTRPQNNYNSARPLGESGLRGAYLDKRNSQWYSKIQIGRQVIFLGNFDTPEEASAAFLATRDRIAGEFNYHHGDP